MDMTRRALLGASAALPLTACAARALGTGVIPMTTGLDRPAELAAGLRGKRIAILTHAAGVDRFEKRSIDVLAAISGVKLTAIWSPEHGLTGQAAAGDHVADGRDAVTGLPIHSLYGKSRAPNAAMLEATDAIFIDLQDVGVRPYTYVSTVAEVLRAASSAGKAVILNDRPNPLGGEVMEGPVLDPKLSSFVGVHPVPLRHGMTIGELAQMINVEAGYKTDLTVLRIGEWPRHMLTADMFNPPSPYTYALPFVPPSPNLRSTDAIFAYAGAVLFEGTTISEGRGTDMPFQTIGAPFMERDKLAAAIPPDFLPGAMLDVVSFIPEASRYKGQKCNGISIMALNSTNYRSVEAALTLLATFIKLYPGKAGFLAPVSPGKTPFFDLLMGDASVRPALLSSTSVADIVARWQPGLAAFAERRKPYLLY